MSHILKPKCDELLDNLDLAMRVAVNFARKRGQYNNFFVDECKVEATFILTCLIYENQLDIANKFPIEEERQRFYMMAIGYKLKEYFSYRATSTIKFLKAKGIVEKHFSLEENSELIDSGKDRIPKYKTQDTTLEVDVVDGIIKNKTQYKILEMYKNGTAIESISVELKLSKKKIKRVLRDIKKRIMDK